MIKLPIGLNSLYSQPFGNSSPEQGKKKYDHDTLLKNNMITNTRIAYDKLANALTVYPAKGLTGNKNSNFYEFLTMGIVPYLVGSVTMMGVFNYASKYFAPFAKAKASELGGKMALGVLFYGLAKELSKPLITKPVKLATGVDVDIPYAKYVYELPDSKNDSDITSIEYHKVFESVEFPRWDLLYGNESKGEIRNAYYDKIAKKMGLGENLKDSDQEVKPRIKEIVTKTSVVKNIVPYLWAGLGVAIAFQKPWESYLKKLDFHWYKYNNFTNTGRNLNYGEKLGGTVHNLVADIWGKTKGFGRTFKESVKEVYEGGEKSTKSNKIAGKLFILLPILATILGDALIILSKKNKADEKNIGSVIQQEKRYVVN